MTYEEIIAQAKIGGTALVRAKIARVDDDDVMCTLNLALDSGCAWIDNDSVVRIDPPEQTFDDLLAENAALKAEIARLKS